MTNAIHHKRIGSMRIRPENYRRMSVRVKNMHPLTRELFLRMFHQRVTGKAVSGRAGYSERLMESMRSNGHLPMTRTLIDIGETLGLELVWREKAIPFIRHKDKGRAV